MLHEIFKWVQTGVKGHKGCGSAADTLPKAEWDRFSACEIYAHMRLNTAQWLPTFWFESKELTP